MRFGDHIADITQKCAPKLRALKAITGQDFGQKKETNITLFKQYYRPTIEYCSTAFAPHLSKTNMDKLQVHQNNALRTAIGTTKTTPIDHLHREAKTLKIKDHMDMRGAQFYDRVRSDPSHTLHHTLHTEPTNRNIRTTPAKYYTNILDTIPPPPTGTNSNTHIHNTLATRFIQELGPNTVLGAIPPEVDDSEATLSREDQVHLSRLRCGHHNALMAYRMRIHTETSDICPLCNAGTHTTHHIMQECPSLTTLRHSYTLPIGILDLWVGPGPSVAYLRDAGLFAQDR